METEKLTIRYHKILPPVVMIVLEAEIIEFFYNKLDDCFNTHINKNCLFQGNEINDIKNIFNKIMENMQYYETRIFD